MNVVKYWVLYQICNVLLKEEFNSRDFCNN
jgi:hypothetical protein